MTTHDGAVHVLALRIMHFYDNSQKIPNLQAYEDMYAFYKLESRNYSN